jgi:predicted DNA-binding transcriptional regulator AlpA
MAERYKNLNTKQVMEYLGVESRQTVWMYVKEGKLPKPRYLSPHRPVWRLGEVVDQLEKNLKPFDIGAKGFRGEPGQVELGGTIKVQKFRERFWLGKG